jgi:hypothetical protein
MRVESKLSGGQVRCPVVLPFIAKQAEVLFDFLVLMFYFAVTLWMVGSSKTSLNTKALVESSHEMGSELWISIQKDLLQNSMKLEYIRVMDISGTLGYKVRLAGHEVALIQIVVNIDTDEIEAVRSRKLGD